MFKLMKEKLKSIKGMTMAEMLGTVSILIILMGVAFIGVFSYQRSMAQMERDSIAKELFIAAQNHLTMSKSENYPGCSVDFLKESGKMSDDDKTAMTKAAGKPEGGSYGSSYKGVHYIIVNAGNVFDNAGSDGHYMLEQMLPLSSIDETVRKGGNYVIRYQPNIGKVMDVFYCSNSGSPEKYNYTLTDEDYNDTGEYGLLSINNKDAKEKRGDYRDDGSIVGWYGGEDLEELGHKIGKPRLELKNGNTLYAESWYSGVDDYTGDDVSLRLIVEGKQSGAKKFFDVDKNGDGSNSSEYKAGNVVFDDITTIDMNFGKRFEITDPNEKKFIPGEDLKVRLVAFSNTKLANIAESDVKEVNSLFAEIADGINESKATSGDSSTYTLNGKTITIESANDGIPDTAYIKNFRHLENLDKNVSNLAENDSDKKLSISKAVQTEDLTETRSWSSFIGDKQIYYSNATGSNYHPANSTSNGKFKPVDPLNLTKGFTYDGKKHSISGVKVEGEYSAGLFGNVSNCKIKNIKLSGFEIKSTGYSAGALAGSLSKSTVTNVIAVGSSSSVSGTNAGGLIGNMDGGKAEYCAAAVTATGTNSAGGLVGIGSGGAVIDGCYSGGHTKDGDYEKYAEDKSYDVTGVTAGGLVGSFSGQIKDSYSTCSVSSSSSSGNAGGLAGSASGSITNCYCTGFVDGADEGNKGTFIGNSSNLTTSNNDKYYAVVNEKQKLDDEVAEALDSSTETFKEYTDKTYTAEAYDNYIKEKYRGSGEKEAYIFKAVEGLAGTAKPAGYDNWSDLFVHTHYGDWPSLELFVINTK